MVFPFLIGEKIYLRKLSEEDAQGNYPGWLNDQIVCNNNSHAVFPYSRKEALDYILNIHKNSESLVLAITLKNDDRHIGNISLQCINNINRSAELAILIGEKDCWGKGYSKEAAKLIVSHGFNKMNLNRICCGTSSKNFAMQKLAQFLGMKEEGNRRKALYLNGEYLDLIEYGLLKDDFC
ncbi:GNAT family N-acetyltransferase [Candidatus Babeliales bacterium]|nr:GNAT family N-acetyltransferase [Candidatus Babeliales bacterium]